MTNPFAPLSAGGAWIKPADHHGHLVIIANATFQGRRFDDMRKQEMDVVKFDFADLNSGQGWETGVQNSHPGIVNKLAGILGNPDGKVLGRIGQVQASNGHAAWALADASPEDVAAAIQWLAANPAPLMAPPAFAPLAAAPAPVAAVPAPVVTAPAPVVLPAVAAPAPAAFAPPVQPQGSVADLLAQLQAAQAQG